MRGQGHKIDGNPAEPSEKEAPVTLDRRTFVKLATVMAASGAALGAGDALSAETQSEITEATIAEAQKLAGLEFTEDERKMMLNGLKRRGMRFLDLRKEEIPNSIPPAIHFRVDPPGFVSLPEGVEPGRSSEKRPIEVGPPTVERPSEDGELALLPVHELARLIKARKVSPVELTEIYLDRLKRIGPKLNCVVTPMDESALERAAEAEAEIRAGRYRGPLHGVPWGAKDLLATRGVRTTWGAKPYEDRTIDEDATVVTRLADAGAILLAKLSMGALAQGDVWFNGRTLNPWNTERGSSGSSAGPAAATAAGLVAFSIGTETLGSIVSPSTACGLTGLRPTFGRVSRHGAMALSWSMDKIGPMCRSVEDCALVFDAIHGADGKDPTAVDFPFDWPREAKLSALRIGYDEQGFDKVRNEEQKKLDSAALRRLRSLGADLVPIELPDGPISAIRLVLGVEAAAAFDELTRSDRDDLLRSQHQAAWPNVFRVARLMPAVEYVQAQRARTRLMHEMAETMREFDLYVAPSQGGRSLLLTNLTGHPTVVLPHGFIAGMPRSISFIGNLFEESKLLAAARLYQESTDWHRKHPIID